MIYSEKSKIKVSDYNESKKFGNFIYVTESTISYITDKENTTFNDLLLRLEAVRNIINAWNITKEEFIYFFNKKNFLVKDLFDFSLYSLRANNTFLELKDAVYEEKEKWVKGKYMIDKKYRNVYVVENKYSVSALKDISRFILREKYKNLYDGFLSETEKYTEEERKYLVGLTSDLSINNLSYNLPILNTLTLGDIVSYMNDNSSILGNRKRSLFKLYLGIEKGNNLIFLDLGKHEFKGYLYPLSLYIPIEAIVNKDFSLVEKQVVHSIPMWSKEDDSKLDFYDGEQKGCWYMDLPQVRKFKELLESN